MPFDTNLTHLNLRPEFSTAHNRNQQLSLNGSTHISQGLKKNAKLPDYLEEDTELNRYSLAPSGLATFELRKRDPPEFSSVLGKKSEKLKVSEVPLNFGFLGRQPQPMKGQHPGMSQPRSRQQSGVADMHLLQQQLMYKQLQDLQRQQQFQQLDRDGRQQSSVNQLSAIAKQAVADQFPSVINGMPVNDASNYTWQNELMGGDSKIPSSSQMFMLGNMNWAQRSGNPAMHGFSNGLMFSHDQGQALRPMGFFQQQLDQSLYGTPVSSNRIPLNQYSQFQGVSNDCGDVMTKPGGNQIEKLPMKSGALDSFQTNQCVFSEQNCSQDGIAAKQSFPGKSFLGHVPVQNVSSGIISGNFQQAGAVGRNMQVQEFQEMQEQADWLGNSQAKTVSQVGPSQGFVNLDPTEQKLLFSTDDEGHWGGSLGSGGYIHGNFQEGNDYLNAFPSVQSGSWSALMQSAVAEASSSDTGLQDEWSGLSYQKNELPSGSHPTMFGDSGKQQTTWVDNNFQSASSLTSRHFPSLDDTDANTNDRGALMFQQSCVKSAYEQNERVHVEASHESLRLPTKDGNNQLDQNQLQKQFLEGSFQGPVHLENNSSGVWAGQLCEQSVSTVQSENAELHPQNMQGARAQQQNTPSYAIGRQTYNKMNSWSTNESLSSGTDAVYKVRDNESAVQHAQMSDSKGTLHIERNHDGYTWKTDGNQMSSSFHPPPGGFVSVKSGIGSPQVQIEDSYMNDFAAVVNSNNSKLNPDMNQPVLNRYHGEYRKHVAINSSVNSKVNEDVGQYSHQPSKGPQARDSSIHNSDKVSGERHDKKRESSFQKEVSNEIYTSNHHSGQRSDSGGRKNSGLRKFQYHPMGNLGVNVEHTGTPKHVSYSQGQSQMTPHGLKGQETGFTGQSQFACQTVSNHTVDPEKRHLFDSERNAKERDGLHSRGTISSNDTNVSSSFDDSAVLFAQNKRPGPTSQNMLELLHKVDQSRDGDTVMHFGFSDHGSTSEGPEAAASNRPAAHFQHSQASALQGFGLRLAPPAQRQSVPSQSLSLHTSQNVNDYKRHLDSEVANESQTSLSTTVPGRSLPPTHVSQREIWDNKSSLSGRSSMETSHTNMQSSSSAMAVSDLPYARNHLQQQQHISIASGHVVADQSVNMSLQSQLDLDGHSKNPSHLRQSLDSHSGGTLSGTMANPFCQPSLPGGASQIQSFKLVSPSDTRVTHSIDTGQSQAMSTCSSYLRNSGQQFPGPETRPVSRSQPSATSGMSRQGGLSAMLHNVWTNVAQQRLSGNQSNKVPPDFVQSISPSSLETTSCPLQKADDQGNKKGESAASEFGACPINSQQFMYGEERAGKDSSLQQMPDNVDHAPRAAGGPQVQEPMTRHTSNGSSSVSIPSLVRLHQQDLVRSKQGQGSLSHQTNNAVLLNIASSNRDIGASGHALKSSDFPNQNYSLLQQMQAMKAVDREPSKWFGKRIKGVDFGAEPQQMFGKGPQKFIYGYDNSVDRVPGDSEPSAAAHAKMLSFSSEANENQNANKASQLISREVPSQELASSEQEVPSHSLSATCVSPSIGGNQRAQVNPQMAPSWFEPYGTFKNGQILATYNGLGGQQKTVKAVAQHYLFSNSSESMDAHGMLEQRNDANQQSSSLHYMPQDVIDHNLVTRPKKRKSATSELLPWHKEITQGFQRLQSISIAELDWSKSAKRLVEKVEDEAEMSEDGSSMPRARRRLILTTQLMQQLLPAIPARILRADATSEFDSVMYLVAKLALGDACSLVSCPGSDSRLPSDSKKMISEKQKTTGRVGNQFFLKVVQDFMGRAKKLESDLSRMEKRASILDVRVDCQDLERFSIINRFAKFHGRGHTEAVESSSTAETAPRRILPQRYVTALTMPGNLPDGVLCLSL